MKNPRLRRGIFIALFHVLVTVAQIFSRYMLMLHYCVTEEHLKLSDLNAKALLPSVPENAPEARHDRHKVWIAEQLGFGTRNYFSRVFQEVTDKTPVEFREN